MGRTRLLLLGCVIAGSLAATATASGAVTPAERQLAERYAPIQMLKVNNDLPCGSGGEQYAPTTVDVTLGNHQVKLELVQKGQKKQVIKSGATPEDISGLSGDYYLNQPGVPYRPGCKYARDSLKLTKDRPHVTYAHYAREEGRPGIALQYFFYYWFNDFNDLHESDWEMIQLAWDDANTPEQALSRPPTQVAYAQHGGGELADWDDDKLEKQGTHPIVYVASGSHASQYESALYLGRGRQGSGLGCDDTRPDSYAIAPDPVIVPTIPTETSQRWLTYKGHWGEHARGYSNGVGGPNMKKQWLHPFTWMDGLRHSTPKMPVSESAGVTTTNFFCGAIIVVADVSNFVGNRTWLVVLAVLAAILLILLPIWRTRWRPASPSPLRQERSAGQVLRVAGILYWRHALTMLSLSVGILAIAFGITRLLQLLADHTGVRLTTDLTSPGIDSLSTFVVFAPAYPIILFLIGSPFVAVLRRYDAGEPATPWAAVREIVPRLPTLLWAWFLAILTVSVLHATVIGIPFAILKAVDWTFAGQEIIFEKRKAREALSASTRHVRGRWWGVAGVDLAVFLVGVVIGPLIGALLIIFTDAPLWTVNLAGLAWFALALPFLITTLTLMYLDPRQQEEKAASAWRRWFRIRRRESALPAEAAR
jgi:hypothetical protein